MTTNLTPLSSWGFSKGDTGKKPFGLVNYVSSVSDDLVVVKPENRPSVKGSGERSTTLNNANLILGPYAKRVRLV